MTNFAKAIAFGNGYSLCKVADFQDGLISGIFGFFFAVFSQTNYYVVVESFFSCFLHF